MQTGDPPEASEAFCSPLPAWPNLESRLSPHPTGAQNQGGVPARDPQWDLT